MSHAKGKALWIFLLAIVAAYVAWPSDNKPGFRPGSPVEGWKLNLGLDLQGGAWFRVRLKPEGLTAEEIRKGTDDAMNILARRVNLRGLKEPRLSKEGSNEIQIEVPGLKTNQDVDQFKKVILSAGKLEFRLEADDALQAEYKKTNIAPPGTKWFEPGGTHASSASGLLCRSDVALDGRAVEKASPGHDENMRPSVSFNMSPEGARAFAQVTNDNIHRQLAIILDGVLVSAPVINGQISDHGIISGNFTQQEVEDLSTVLSTGSLAAPLEMVGSSFLGPSLGQDSIDRGFRACTISLVAVMAFMLFYYRHAGLVANVAMLINVALLLALLAVFGATLTLPGIAGIVLTMGMAVDANILVFERMREEKDAGRSPVACMEAGYSRAFSAILDSNLTTLITGILLYVFGTGPIQGFAVTLSLGIATTLFTALTCSHTLMQLLMQSGMVKEWKMLRALAKPNIPFMKIAPKAVAVSLVFIVIGLVVWFARGERKYGMDFRGGVAVHMRFKQRTSIDDVRAGVAAIQGEAGPKYPSAEVQSVLLGTDAGGSHQALQFQIRTLSQEGNTVMDPEAFKEVLVADLRRQFAGKIPEGSIRIGAQAVEAPNPYAGGGTFTLSLDEERPAKATVERLQKRLSEMGVARPAEALVPYVVALDASGKPSSPEKSAAYEIWLMPRDFVAVSSLAERVAESVKSMGYPLSGDPFPSVETVSASIVSELKEKAIMALVLSWIGIIIYLAVRFEWRYGVAAVVALIHDAIIAVTWTVVIDALLPKAWGIDLSVSLTTVAAALTVKCYSVNDTVIIFDRLRENSREARTKGLSQVIDEALNQTLSRTIITSLTVFFVVSVLLGVTLTSGGGIAALSLPMLIGVIDGTYSSLFIAAPLLYWWRARGKEAARS
ncbi:MAG: protein translocase subunit SecD [Planctomycetes bacterium]|nr:protein translocase subunit SecD [Planctomycetota bacterium]